MDIHIIPILDDNYAYIIQSGDMVGVIDPGEAQPIIDYIDNNNMSLDWIINTHKHWDHVDGNPALIQKYNPKIAAAGECDFDKDITLTHGEPFTFGDITFDVTLTKGHTNGHVVLYDPTYRILFSGDTLFAMGCGRLFEGSPSDMFAAMGYIKSLPPETLIYCGHEYTATNAKFAQSIMPDNKDIQSRSTDIIGQQCTIPTLLAHELKTNPFLLTETVDQFTDYRLKRDTF